MESNAEHIQEKLDALLLRCREAGMNVTPQRLAVYRALLEAEDHPSPEVLYNRVRPSMPSLSLATIYKALDALEKLGVVQEVSLLSETKRYDANLEHHHHLVCARCKKVMDFYDAGLDVTPPANLPGGFVPWGVSVQVVGLCDVCAAAGGH